MPPDTETPAPITAQTSIRELNDAQAYGHDAAGAVIALVTHMEATAERLRMLSNQLRQGDGRAMKVAAEITNDYTQAAGAAGVRLWTLITSAADADREFAKQKSETPDAP